MKKQILAVLILITGSFSVIWGGPGPEVMYIEKLNINDYKACIQVLDTMCLDKLNGGGNWLKWFESNKMDDKFGALWKAAEEGTPGPIAVTLRLCIILDGEYAEGSMESAGKSMESNPSAFLEGFKGFADIFVKAGKTDDEKFYADRIIHGMMFSYVDRAEEKLSALKVRMAKIQGVKGIRLTKIKERVIAYLDQGIKETQTSVDLEKKYKKQ